MSNATKNPPPVNPVGGGPVPRGFARLSPEARSAIARLGGQSEAGRANRMANIARAQAVRRAAYAARVPGAYIVSPGRRSDALLFTVRLGRWTVHVWDLYRSSPDGRTPVGMEVRLGRKRVLATEDISLSAVWPIDGKEARAACCSWATDLMADDEFTAAYDARFGGE